MLTRLAVPALAICFLAAPAGSQQQPVPLPDSAGLLYTAPKPGFTVVYDTSNTYAPEGGLPREVKQTTVITITASQGDEQSYSFAIDSGVPILARSFRGVLTVEADTEPGRIQTIGNHAALRALWPLAVGRKLDHDIEARFARRNPQTRELGNPQTIGMATQRWSIESRQTLETPAGRFDTFLIRRQWDLVQRTGATVQTGDYKIWFAPELGSYVRFEGDEKGGGTRRVVHVAREIKGR